MGDRVKINLGAGMMPVAGYVSLDAHPYTPDTLVCRFPPLPYEDATVESVFCGHCLEHMEPWNVLPLLEECKRVLLPSGSLTVIVPDERKARLSMLSGRLKPEWYCRTVAGDDHDDMPHWTIWSQARLEAVLIRAGFVLDPSYDFKADSRVYDVRAPNQAAALGVKS